MVLPALIGGAAALGSAFLGKKSADKALAANQADFGAIQQIYGPLADWGSIFGLQQEGFEKQEGALQDALKQAQQGALTTSKIGDSAKQSVLDREQQRMGNLTQSLTNRGLGNTTIGANLARGIGADTDRALAAIDESIAGLQLQVQQNQMQALGNLASMYGQQTGAQTNALAQLASLYSNKQNIAAPPVNLGGLADFGVELVQGVGGQLGLPDWLLGKESE